MTSQETRSQIVNLVREFVRRDVEPVAMRYDRDDVYPAELADKMAAMGLFGLIIPEEYGGLGLDYTTFATVFEELSRGWMSLTGLIGTHHAMVYTVVNFGTEEQKRRLLPRMASGELRGGLGLTEPGAGSDVANIQTTARRDGGDYLLNGAKMFITNAVHGAAFAVLARTDTAVKPPHKGMSCFIVEKTSPGFRVGRKLDKLGYRGVDTAELIFQDCRVPAKNLVGGVEGKGFAHVMSALESGRINVAARALGVATAAFEAAIRYSQQRTTQGKPIAEHQVIKVKLADMATKIQAARLLTYDAAARKDAGERADLEAGMAKLYASEVCGEVALEAMRIHGGVGYIKDLPIERHYRDAPLLIIGDGTSEVLKLLIARRLLERYAV
ncbi:MAG: acyl-CoA dehydrogenase [SAR202 cluster bacterium]|nr:acyl-CoA dehydrogenase [SAR202 cluster bacterium]